jgi:hypothetical protein
MPLNSQEDAIFREKIIAYSILVSVIGYAISTTPFWHYQKQHSEAFFVDIVSSYKRPLHEL